MARRITRRQMHPSAVASPRRSVGRPPKPMPERIPRHTGERSSRRFLRTAEA